MSYDGRCNITLYHLDSRHAKYFLLYNMKSFSLKKVEK